MAQPDPDFLKFFAGDWQKLLTRVEIPGMTDPSWDRKAAYLLWKYGIDDDSEGCYRAGYDELLGPIPGPLAEHVRVAREWANGVLHVPQTQDNGVKFSFDARPFLPVEPTPIVGTMEWPI